MMISDYIQGEKFIALGDNVKIFFVPTHEVNTFFKNLPTDEGFVLVSHNSDGCIMSHPNRVDHADIDLAPYNMIHWFGQNVNVIDQRVSSLPLGLENSRWLRKINKIALMEEAIAKSYKKRNLMYVNHSISTNPAERMAPYRLFTGKSWATVERGRNGKDFQGYIANLCSHEFILCPMGNGIDTIRTWEALYMGVIPIEKRNLNNRHYQDLPICFVDNWGEITEGFLAQEANRIKAKTWNLDKLKFTYWKDKIQKYADQ